jgi:CheY-like chemotaxis protein
MSKPQTVHSSSGPDRYRNFALVVDRDRNNLSYLSKLLARFHYQCFKASSGAEALQSAAVVAPSLVMIALDLEDMDSFELMRNLRQGAGMSRISLVGLLQREDQNLKDRCFENGAIACLTQPVDAEALYRTVQMAIEKHPRANLRVKTVLPVKVHGKQDVLYGAYTLALSTGGMFLRTMNPVPVNSEMSVEFDLNGRAIAADTVVVYNCQGRGGPCEEPGVGLRFVDISFNDRNIIREFIMSEVMKDLAPAAN